MDVSDKITEVKKYQTDDGQIFTHLSDAERHVRINELTEYLAICADSPSFIRNGVTKDRRAVAQFIVDYFDDIEGIARDD